MRKINVLDCTLRDGGYINKFYFGESVIQGIVSKLSKASIDIIECGFLVSGETDKNKSLFGSVGDIQSVLKKRNPNLMYVAMIQYGAISIEEISDFDGNSIDGIRVTFHEHEIEEACVLGRALIKKGYKVFMQPVGTMTYTDESLLNLIEKINDINPFAFYIVDTLGTMYKKDLLKMFKLVDDNLKPDVAVGFHSHNNLQLSFSNAQELISIETSREIILDASVFGMGRGAGNLSTELITRYINDNIGLKYDVIQVLEVMDEYIKPLSLQYKWGYDAAYYVAAVSGCHPNYASFLLDKQTLHVQDIAYILGCLDKKRSVLFDKEYIEQEYVRFMDRHIDDGYSVEKLKRMVDKKKVVLIAPGKSIKGKEHVINQLYESDDNFVVSINFKPQDFKCNMLFISNIKRFSSLQEVASNNDCITFITSNIGVEKEEGVHILDYMSYTNEESCVFDNSGLMCLNLFNKIGVKEVILMGFDGFSFDNKRNYYDITMLNGVEKERLENINEAMKRKFSQLRVQMEIKFLTPSAYDV